MDGDGVVGARRRDRSREGRGLGRAGVGGLHGPAGRVGDGAREGRVVRRQDPQLLVDVDGAQHHLLPRALRPATHSLVAHGRPPRAALVRLLAALLQPRPDLHERVPRRAAARLSRRSHVVDRLPRSPCEPGALVARLAARGARRLPRRPADRPQLRDAARRDRRRSRGRHRRRPDPRRPGAVRPHAGHRGQGLWPGRLRRSDPRPHPDERSLRSRQRARRHVRTDGVPRVRPRRAHARLVGQVGLASGRARDRDRLRPARHPRPVPRRPALRRHTARYRARVRLGRVSVHRLRDELQLERHDHARDPRVGILALDLRRRPRCDDRARRLDEVRRAAPGATLAHVSERPPSPHRGEVRNRVRRRDAGRVLDPAVRAEPDDGGALVRQPHARLSARPRLALLALGLGPVPRERDPEPPCRAGDPAGRRPRARRRRLGDPAAQGPARARRAERCRARSASSSRSPTGRTSTSRGSCPSCCSRCCCRGASRSRCASRQPEPDARSGACRRRCPSRSDAPGRAFLALFAAVAALAVGLVVARLEGDPEITRYARLSLPTASGSRAATCRTATSCRVPAGSAGAVRRARARHLVARTATTRPSRRSWSSRSSPLPCSSCSRWSHSAARPSTSCCRSRRSWPEWRCSGRSC